MEHLSPGNPVDPHEAELYRRTAAQIREQARELMITMVNTEAAVLQRLQKMGDVKAKADALLIELERRAVHYENLANGSR